MRQANRAPNANSKHQSGDRTTSGRVRDLGLAGDRGQAGSCLDGVRALETHIVFRARALDLAGSRHSGSRSGATWPPYDRRDGETTSRSRRRSSEVGKRLPVLCAACRAVSPGGGTSDGGSPELHPLRAGRPGACNHALEFSLLAGLPVCGARDHGGECGSAEARAERTKVRNGHREYFHASRFSSGRPKLADRDGPGSRRPGRSCLSRPSSWLAESTRQSGLPTTPFMAWAPVSGPMMGMSRLAS
jgi:hypothetical protein